MEWKLKHRKRFQQLARPAGLLLMILMAHLVPEPGHAALPPGEPTFFAGNPVTRHLAFRYRVGLRVLGWDFDNNDDRTGVHGLFSQSSFWFLDNEDRGYTVESNYEPEVMLFIDGDRLGGFWPEPLDLGLSYSHHSNGIDADLSRSWNHLNLGFYLGDPASQEVSASLVAWFPFNQEVGNEDITEYAGHGKLTLYLNPRHPLPWLGRSELYLAANFSGDGDSVFTNLETSLSFAPGWLGRPPFPGPEPGFAFFVQWFLGRGESLIQYAAYQNTVRFGLRLW
jgi:hypothetical protein